MKHLRQNQVTGLLDWTFCVRSLDAHVFKAKLMSDQPDLNDIKNIKSRLLFSLKELVRAYGTYDRMSINTICAHEFVLTNCMYDFPCMRI